MWDCFRNVLHFNHRPLKTCANFQNINPNFPFHDMKENVKALLFAKTNLLAKIRESRQLTLIAIIGDSGLPE